MCFRAFGVLFVLLTCGCVSTLHVPAGALRAVPPADAIPASLRTEVQVTPTTTWGGATQGNGYNNGWGSVLTGELPVEMTSALDTSGVFGQGINKSETPDLSGRVKATVGCTDSGGDKFFVIGMIIGTLDIWPFLGGPFPTTTKATVDIELSQPGVPGSARSFSGEAKGRGWAPMYTIHGRHTRLAQETLVNATQSAVDKMLADKKAVTQLALRSRNYQAQAMAQANNFSAVPVQPLLREVELPARTFRHENVAVAELTSDVLSVSEVVTLSEVLRGALVETDYFMVVSRGDMGSILKEQQFQQSSVCSDTQCLVEMGKLLAVRRMVGGMVGKVGETYSVTLRLVDVQTGRIDAVAIMNVKSSPDELLNIIRNAGRTLALKYQQAIPVASK